MIPYILFVAIILFFRNRKKPFMLYLTMLLFNVLRYDTGWDYMSYWNEVVEWGNVGSNMARYSLPWQWLFATAQELNMPHLALAIPGFLTLTIVYWAVVKIQEDKYDICDSLTIYALWPFFFLSTFSTIRQALAISISLVILYCAMKRKVNWFILLLLIDIIIHPSSIVCVGYAVFFIKNFKLNFWKIILISTFLIIGMFSANFFINNITFLNSYTVYLGENNDFGSKLSILLGVILILVMLVRKGGNKGLIDIYILALIHTIFIFVFMSNSTLSRVVEYYLILLIFVAPFFKKLFKNKVVGNTVVVCAFVGIFFVYLIHTLGASQQGLATSPYVPYKIIFFR